MNFRPSTKSDLGTVMTWMPDAESCLIWAGPKVTFPLELEQLYRAIEFEKVRTYSIDDDQNLLALGQVRMFENNRGHLSRIVVNPASRGKGVGRIFCEKLINEARRLDSMTISLNVFKDNSNAIRLYKRLGFSISADSPDDVRIRENIVRMVLG